jgi:hypothetical protein
MRPSQSRPTSPRRARSISIWVSGIGHALGEHRLAQQLGRVGARELRRRHAGEGRELVDHAADVAHLADDGVGAAVEGLQVAGDLACDTCAAAARPRAGSASAGS